MSDEQKVADKRTVVQNPLIDDPNAGIIVAAGDPLPTGLTGIVSNTPNKVDAAANYDEVDAADKAGPGARPATTVVSAGDGVDPEIAKRVAENRSSWFDESDELARQASSPGTHPAEGGPQPQDAAQNEKTSSSSSSSRRSSTRRTGARSRAKTSSSTKGSSDAAAAGGADSTGTQE